LTYKDYAQSPPAKFPECDFFKGEVEHLGHLVSKKGIFGIQRRLVGYLFHIATPLLDN
jgi:hypothetical protein